MRNLAAAAFAVTVLLTGCGDVQDAATGAASQAASAATTAAAQAAAREARQQVCSRIQDGQVSAQDKQVLAGLVSAAKAAGVPAEITGPLDQIAQSGDRPPAEAVDALRKACDTAGTS